MYIYIYIYIYVYIYIYIYIYIYKGGSLIHKMEVNGNPHNSSNYSKRFY